MNNALEDVELLCGARCKVRWGGNRGMGAGGALGEGGEGGSKRTREHKVMPAEDTMCI